MLCLIFSSALSQCTWELSETERSGWLLQLYGMGADEFLCTRCGTGTRHTSNTVIDPATPVFCPICVRQGSVHTVFCTYRSEEDTDLPSSYPSTSPLYRFLRALVDRERTGMASRDAKGEPTIALRDAVRMYVTYLKRASQIMQIPGARDAIAARDAIGALEVGSNTVSP